MGRCAGVVSASAAISWSTLHWPPASACREITTATTMNWITTTDSSTHILVWDDSQDPLDFYKRRLTGHCCISPRGPPHHILSSSCPHRCGRHLRPISWMFKARSCPNLRSSTRMHLLSSAMTRGVPRAAMAYPPSFPILTQPPPRQFSKTPASTSQPSMAHSPQQHVYIKATV